MQKKALLLTFLLAALMFSPGCMGGGSAELAAKETVPAFTVIADDGLEYGSERDLRDTSKDISVNYDTRISVSPPRNGAHI